MNNMRETQEMVLFPIKYYQRFLAIHVINKNVVVHEETWGHMTNIDKHHLYRGEVHEPKS